jgi:hypothetical protein
VVGILLVLQKFHVSSTWLVSWMFSPVSVCRWRVLESHYLTEQWIVVYWRWNNVCSFKSVSIAKLWMRGSSVFSDFRSEVWCRSQTSNQYQTMRAMSLYLILNKTMTISVLEIIKYDIFSDVEIVFFLFQTALQHHDTANGCGHDIRNFCELSLCLFGMYQLRI